MSRTIIAASLKGFTRTVGLVFAAWLAAEHVARFYEPEELKFTESLSLEGDAAEKFTDRLTRLASGAAYVSAKAEGKQE